MKKRVGEKWAKTITLEDGEKIRQQGTVQPEANSRPVWVRLHIPEIEALSLAAKRRAMSRAKFMRAALQAAIALESNQEGREADGDA